MLKFYYGAMNSGKSLQLLTTGYQLEQQGKKILYFKPSSDTRQTTIKSRLGVSQEAISVNDDFNIFEHVSKLVEEDNIIDVIMCDEIQFFEKQHISQLRKVVDKFDIEVRVFGLKNSYVEGEIFDTIKYVLFEADTITEIESSCEFCNNKATHHLRVLNGEPIRTGESINVGDVGEGSDYYISCCRKHYHSYRGTKRK